MNSEKIVFGSTFSNAYPQGTQLAPLDAHAGHGEALLTAVDLPKAARPDTDCETLPKNFDCTDIFQSFKHLAASWSHKTLWKLHSDLPKKLRLSVLCCGKASSSFAEECEQKA